MSICKKWFICFAMIIFMSLVGCTSDNSSTKVNAIKPDMTISQVVNIMGKDFEDPFSSDYPICYVWEYKKDEKLYVAFGVPNKDFYSDGTWIKDAKSIYAYIETKEGITYIFDTRNR